MNRIKYTEKDYIKKCNELNDIYLGYHKTSPKQTTIIDYICLKHKDKGPQSSDWGHFRLYRKSCPYCSGRKLPKSDVVSILKNKGIELLGDYKTTKDHVKCRCNKCGHLWEPPLRGILNNNAGCPICGRQIVSKKRMKTQEQFINDLSMVNPDIKVIGEYTGSHSKIKCECKIDGTVWESYPINLLNNSAGCPSCNISNPEREMVNILKELGFNITQQYMIDGCKLIKKLRFDAFDTSLNIAFEYNGEQHYRPVNFGGIDDSKAQEAFNRTLLRDNAKIDFCKQNGIEIIIVPYWEKSNIKQFIIQELDKKGINIS